jgi:hypothetical protein
MMGRWLALIGVLASIASAEPAIAGGRRPVCREPSVVDEMTREVRDRNYYGEVDPTLVTETPTADANMVRCQVCVLSAPYDTVRRDGRPIRQCLAHGFEVRILRSGFVVRDLK